MTISGEIWRQVPSAPDVLASSEGRVMRRPSNQPTPDGKGYRAIGGTPGWGTWDRQQGRFLFTVNGTTHKVHRLVCEAFHGPRPFPEAIVLHVDERSSNNRASNLKWGTHVENYTAPGYLEYCRNRTGENSTAAKAKRKKEADWLRQLRQVEMFDSTMENAE